MCVCATCMCITHGGQKRASGPVELNLQMVVSCLVGTGN